MIPATRSIEELQRSETVEPSTSLKLLTLVRQLSLQNLIGEEMSPRGDGSLEMAALLMRRDENADFDCATIEAPTSETQDERPETPPASTSGHKSIQGQATAYLHNDTRFPRASLRRRLSKRCFRYI